MCGVKHEPPNVKADRSPGPQGRGSGRTACCTEAQDSQLDLGRRAPVMRSSTALPASARSRELPVNRSRRTPMARRSGRFRGNVSAAESLGRSSTVCDGQSRVLGPSDALLRINARSGYRRQSEAAVQRQACADAPPAGRGVRGSVATGTRRLLNCDGKVIPHPRQCAFARDVHLSIPGSRR